jgi:hypothetical protein
MCRNIKTHLYPFFLITLSFFLLFACKPEEQGATEKTAFYAQLYAGSGASGEFGAFTSSKTKLTWAMHMSALGNLYLSGYQETGFTIIGKNNTVTYVAFTENTYQNVGGFLLKPGTDYTMGDMVYLVNTNVTLGIYTTSSGGLGGLQTVRPNGVLTNGSLSIATYVGGNFPISGAFDSQGTMFVSLSSHQLSRVNVNTYASQIFAGSSAAGFVNSANPLNARFSSPRGVAIDGNNDLYVADKGNHAIRKIAGGVGAVTTLAGNGVMGNADGSGTNASFIYPIQLVVDSRNNIYVYQFCNDALAQNPEQYKACVKAPLRKITPNGVVTTPYVMGGESLKGNQPNAMAIDNSVYPPILYISVPNQGSERWSQIIKLTPIEPPN